MYRVILCDDEAATLEQLCGYLRQLAAEERLELSVSCCRSGEELLNAPPEHTDLLVLDIGMDGISGMEAARSLRERGEEAEIIFLTSMVQYALEGYDVHAFAFLPKPVAYGTFAEKVKGALEEVSSRRGSLIALKSGMDTDYVSAGDILYIDVQDHNIRLVHTKGSKTYYTKLSVLERQLEGQGFFRCHKSFLVNHRQIRAIRQDHLVMANGDRVPLSKHRRKEFLADFSRFMGRRQTL